MLNYFTYIFVCLLLTSAGLSISHAQTDNSVERIKEARELAARNKYEEALQLIDRALLQNPDNYDLNTMRIRLLGWQGSYELALLELQKLKITYPNNLELLELALDIRYFANQFEELTKSSDEILAINPTHITALYRKALAKYELNEYENALNVLSNLLSIEPFNTIALALERMVRERLQKNEIGISYRYSTFSEVFSDWHNASVHYTRNTDVGPLIFRANLARQFEQTGFQPEVDFYPKLGRKTYAYLNAGLSNADIFPQTRFGAELFRALPFGLEVSLGLRYMYYEISDDQLWIYTGNVSKYFGNNMLSYRPMFIQLRNEITLTSIITYRHFLSNRNHYFGAVTAYGRAPVDFVSIFEILRLSAARIGLEYQQPLANNFYFKATAEFQHEEYFEKIYRQRYALEVMLSKRS
jgi:YaiO family outer membrane protein